MQTSSIRTIMRLKDSHFIKATFFLIFIMLIYNESNAYVAHEAENIYSFHFLSTQSKLPVSNIYTLMQDSKGYMWYGTIGGGLCRDNGYQIDVISLSKLANNPDADNILSVTEDSLGRIWCGTDAGVFTIDPSCMSVSAVSGISGQIYAISKTNDNNIWIGMANNALRLSADGKTILKKYENLPGWKVNCIYESSDSNIYILLPNTIMRLDKRKDQFEPITTDIEIDPVHICQDMNGQFWISTWDKGVVAFDPITNEIHTQKLIDYDKTDPKCISMLVDHLHNLMWVTTTSNLCIFGVTPSQWSNDKFEQKQ